MTASSRRFGFGLVLFWMIGIAYEAIQLARGVPDSYRGQHRGSVLMAVAWLLLCAGQLASSPRMRHITLLTAWIPLVAALYVVGLFAR